MEQSLKRLGADLRKARPRRNPSLETVAEKIGAHRRVIADAESGKPSTGIAIYAALLWTFGLLPQLDDVAAPERDQEGIMFSGLRELSAPVKEEISTMISKSSPTECFVYITLPGQIDPVTAGRSCNLVRDRSWPRHHRTRLRAHRRRVRL